VPTPVRGGKKIAEPVNLWHWLSVSDVEARSGS
jgi:hypothetical protein